MSRAVPGPPGWVSFTRASGRWMRFALRNEPGEGKAERWGKPRPEPGARDGVGGGAPSPAALREPRPQPRTAPPGAAAGIVPLPAAGREALLNNFPK